ncbi:hypothetical protein ABFX02_09G049000 [Erythranthe guttata]
MTPSFSRSVIFYTFSQINANIFGTENITKFNTENFLNFMYRKFSNISLSTNGKPTNGWDDGEWATNGRQRPGSYWAAMLKQSGVEEGFFFFFPSSSLRLTIRLFEYRYVFVWSVN